MSTQSPRTPPGHKPRGLLTAFLDLPNDSTVKTLIVALLLCLVCSALVSTAAVRLKPLQVANQELDKKLSILEATRLLREGTSPDELFEQLITARVVDLATGHYVESIDPRQYDQYAAAKDPAQSISIPADRDIAQIRRRAKYATVYLHEEDDKIKYFILPIHGSGLWSTMYGFLVLEGDANTVFGILYYDQRETAGLGSEVANPDWQAKWQGKLVYDHSGKPRIEVIKGTVAANDPEAKYRVDGIAGATLTANGVTHMIHYWLGDDGFGPYLRKFRSET